PLEFRILHLLLMNQGRVIPYSRLIEYGWGYYDENNSNLLKTHVSHLRKKLGLPAQGPSALRSVVGVGYCLNHATGPAAADQGAVAVTPRTAGE
ncbi:MAG TPA: helix-turn-helix domain-containing protein, partial [Chloroflexota bacterium]|nr:helix-turn-helix domain-containing protein [Chloroflexota bacterium]